MRKIKVRSKKFDARKVRWQATQRGNAIRWEKEGQSVVGILRDSRKVKTKNGEQFIFSIDNGDTVVDVWETSALQVLHRIPKGSPVRITWNGKRKLRGGHTFNDFTVETDKSVSLT